MHQSTLTLINNEVKVVVVPKISTQATAETSPSILEETDPAEQPLHHARRNPIWMMDYKVTWINVNEVVSHFALFANWDPTTFKNIIKEKKWRKAMDDDVDAIERNETLELLDLSKGHKTIGVK